MAAMEEGKTSESSDEIDHGVADVPSGRMLGDIVGIDRAWSSCLMGTLGGSLEKEMEIRGQEN